MTAKLKHLTPPLVDDLSLHEKLISFWCLKLLFAHTGAAGKGERQLQAPDEILTRICRRIGVDLDGCDEELRMISLGLKFEQLQSCPSVAEGSALAANLAFLSSAGVLDSLSSELLAFFILAKLEPALGEILGALGPQSLSQLATRLASALGASSARVRESLDPEGCLGRSGLVFCKSGELVEFHSLIDLLPGFALRMIEHHAAPMAAFRDYVAGPAGPNYVLGDFPQMAQQARLLGQCLVTALAKGEVGANVLVHGALGSGRTSFVQALGGAYGLVLRFVAAETTAGQRLNSSQRIRVLQFALALSRHDGAVVVMDNAGDLLAELPAGDWSENAGPEAFQGWVNGILDSNRSPVLWITSRQFPLQVSHRQRFSMVIEVKTPDPAARAHGFDTVAHDLAISKVVRQAIVEHSDISGPMLRNAVAVLRRVAAVPECDLDEALLALLNGSLQHMGASKLVVQAKPAHVFDFDRSLLNADQDLDRLCAGLRQAQSGRLCLYGPPGTGKTAFARHVAEYLGRPLLTRRASDLLGKYVGQSEAAVAKAFAKADQEQAVLLIDEADSFLQERTESSRSWERTLVNEMLTQMETFEGIFIASTNLMETLDSAALRRFDLKIRFDALNDAQRRTVVELACKQLGLDIDGLNEARLRRIGSITPGTIATVLRRARLIPLQSFDELAEALKGEAQQGAQSGGPYPIGFQPRAA